MKANGTDSWLIVSEAETSNLGINIRHFLRRPRLSFLPFGRVTLEIISFKQETFTNVQLFHPVIELQRPNARL